MARVTQRMPVVRLDDGVRVGADRVRLRAQA